MTQYYGQKAFNKLRRIYIQFVQSNEASKVEETSLESLTLNMMMYSWKNSNNYPRTSLIFMDYLNVIISHKSELVLNRNGFRMRRDKNYCTLVWTQPDGETTFLQIKRTFSVNTHIQQEKIGRGIFLSLFSVTCKSLAATNWHQLVFCRSVQKYFKRHLAHLNHQFSINLPCQTSLDRFDFVSTTNFSLFIRYNMQREEINSQEILSSDQLEERYSIDQDCQDQQEIEQVLISDSKIEELHRSVDRLREFITALPEQQVTLVPTCVEEYCDKMTKYHVQNGQEVLQMAERRVNKMLRNRKIKRNWNSEDITLLVWLVSQRLKIIQPAHFSQMSKQDWDFISNMISGSTWQKCKFKWLSLKKVKLVTHKWTKGESKILSEAIAQQDKINWKVVSERLYERNSSKTKVFRTAKQCREHWNCFLNPTIQKGPWTLQEDHRLLEFVLELQGSKKWSQIAKFMEGRTQNALKNRFNLLVGRQRKTSGHLTEKRLIKICLSKLMLQEKQQRPSLSNIQSLDLLREQKRQEEERPRSQRQEDKKTSTMPTIPSPLYHQSQLSFANSYENLVTIFNNNVESIGGSMISSPVGTPNTMFFGFVFPNQF